MFIIIISSSSSTIVTRYRSQLSCERRCPSGDISIAKRHPGQPSAPASIVAIFRTMHHLESAPFAAQVDPSEPRFASFADYVTPRTHHAFSPWMVATTLLVCFLARNSRYQIPCQVPVASLPLLMGMVTLEPIRADLMCAYFGQEILLVPASINIDIKQWTASIDKAGRK